jgi:signal transduction histidine kinase
LASILGLATSIHRIDIEPKKVMHTSSLIYAEAFSLDFQLKNIFAAAEIEAGEFILGHMTVDIKSLIEGVTSSYNHILKKKKIELNISSEVEDNFTFTTDSEKIQIVISNILNNAIEYSKENSKIDVSYTFDNNVLSISIADYGVGIPQEKQKAIYDRFKQLDAGTTKSHHGHGLGLSITTAVMQLLAGSIDLVSTEGKGSMFTVSIPQGEANEGDDFSSDGNEFLFSADETF